MRITVARSGGYAGIAEEPVTIETGELDAGTKQRIEDLVEQMGFFTLPAEAGGVGADMFRYEISVSDGSRTHMVTFVDDGSQQTESLRRLVEAVTAGV